MSMLSAYQSEVGKLTADIALLRRELSQERSKEATSQKNVADLERRLASKTKDLHAAEQRLAKERDRSGFASGSEAFDHPADPDTLAKEQGVSAADFDDLLGDFWPEDEEPGDFTTSLGEWRRDHP